MPRLSSVLGAFALILAAPKPRVVLKPATTRSPLIPVPGLSVEKKMAVWIDGRDTGKRVPTDWRVTEFSNKRGDVAGMFWSMSDGGYIAYSYYPFALFKGKGLKMLPPPPTSTNPCIVGVDERGRILAIDAPNAFGRIMVDVKAFRRAHLYKDGAWLDLGAADDATISPDGTVRGEYTVDEAGRPTNTVADPIPPRAVRVARFVWRNGRRRNLR